MMSLLHNHSTIHLSNYLGGEAEANFMGKFNDKSPFSLYIGNGHRIYPMYTHHVVHS
jgi:hypothetical protein